jgi:hypothetical protein
LPVIHFYRETEVKRRNSGTRRSCTRDSKMIHPVSWWHETNRPDAHTHRLHSVVHKRRIPCSSDEGNGTNAGRIRSPEEQSLSLPLYQPSRPEPKKSFGHTEYMEADSQPPAGHGFSLRQVESDFRTDCLTAFRVLVISCSRLLTWADSNKSGPLWLEYHMGKINNP